MGSKIVQSDNEPVGTCFSFAFEYSKIKESEINPESAIKFSEIKSINSILPKTGTMMTSFKPFPKRQSPINLIKESIVSKSLTEISLERNETVVIKIFNTNKPKILDTSCLSNSKKTTFFRNNSYNPKNRLNLSYHDEISNDMIMNKFDYYFQEIDSLPDLIINRKENHKDKIKNDLNFFKINSINEETDIAFKINKYFKY